MDSSEQMRQLVPVFVEKTEGQDISDLLYVRDGNGAFRSLAELQSSSKLEDCAEVPGVLTTSIIETSSAARGTRITSASVSPFRVRCIVIGGTKICFPY
jgi:hypothetical protein